MPVISGQLIQSIEGFGFESDVGFARGFFGGVFFHPGFPALAGSRIAAGEGEGGDVGVRDSNLFVGRFGIEAYDGVFQG